MPMRVTILHPDLGIGGAERLIVDAAVALESRHHRVKIVTNHYDKTHCFKETEDLEIIQVFSWFPRSIFGKMHALCAYFKMIMAALYIVIFHRNEQDVILSDTVSASQFVLKWFSNAKLVFYCHFPDMLLTKRDSRAKGIYRKVIDAIEEYTTGLADVICVNSKFTESIVHDTFESLKQRKLVVLYPSLNTEYFDSIERCELDGVPTTAQYVYTSLNRFERKKNVKLALDAFAELKRNVSSDEFKKCHLVIAGGYDKKNRENIEYFEELEQHLDDIQLDTHNVTFMKSPSDEQKVNLIRRSRAILYTPDREHFGIVPVEAMYLGAPVIAVKSGGPCESVKHGETGYLVEQTDVEFAKRMMELMRNEEKWREMSEQGPIWVNQVFAFEAFTSNLDEIVQNVMSN